MKKALLLALMCRSSLAAPDLHDFYANILAVERSWDKFVRTSFGCTMQPDEPTDDKHCTGKGTIDFALFEKWWHAAEKLHGGK